MRGDTATLPRCPLASLAPAVPPCVAGCSAGLTVSCGINTFQPQTNQISAGACKQCPRFAESGENSASIENCNCQEGYYDSESTVGNVTCKLCPIGSECKRSGYTLALLPLL